MNWMLWCADCREEQIAAGGGRGMAAEYVVDGQGVCLAHADRRLKERAASRVIACRFCHRVIRRSPLGKWEAMLAIELPAAYCEGSAGGHEPGD